MKNQVEKKSKKKKIHFTLTLKKKILVYVGLGKPTHMGLIPFICFLALFGNN